GGSISGIVSVNASANDNVGLTRVELLVNGTLLATDTTTPYGFSWDSAAFAGSTDTLVARAYDAAGNFADSAAVTVIVASTALPPGPDTTPPTVSISAPPSGTVSGVVTVNVTATDNVGVTRVDLLVNGAVFASDTTAPYTFNWDTTALAGTTNTLTARAYDAAGNSGDSQTVTVTVASASGGSSQDTTPPTVIITTPSNGSTVSGNVTIATTATDNVGVA